MPNPISAFDRDAWRRILAALELAVLAHGAQVDKGGQPYIWHVFRVGFSLLPDVDACILGILHDICEDQPQFSDAARGQLAERPELLLDLEALTKLVGERYDEYLERIGPRWRARQVKLADLRDNMLAWRHVLAAERVGWARIVLLRRRYTSAIAILENWDADHDIAGQFEFPQKKI